MSELTKRILVIDDDHNIHNIIKKFIGNHKYDLIHAYTLQEGLASITYHQPNVVLLDINLGKESGFSALQKIVATTKCYPIMMSVDAFNQNVRKSIALGAADFIAKPLVNKTLLQKIRKAFLKIDNDLCHVKIPEKQGNQWICTLETKHYALDGKTKAILCDSLSLLKENIHIDGHRYKRLGIPKKLKNGKIKTILSQLVDNINVKDDFSNSVVYEQEDLLSKGQISIYALDDDQNFLDIVELFCLKNNIAIKTFSSRKLFHDAIERSCPQLCLIDLSIESSNDSFDLIENLKGKYQDLPIIVVTSNTDGKSSHYAMDIGADDFIYKPI